VPKKFKKSALAFEIASLLCGSLLAYGSSNAFAETYTNIILSSQDSERTAGDLNRFDQPGTEFSLTWDSTARQPKALVQDTDIIAKDISITVDPASRASIVSSDSTQTSLNAENISLANKNGTVIESSNAGSVVVDGFSTLVMATNEGTIVQSKKSIASTNDLHLLALTL